MRYAIFGLLAAMTLLALRNPEPSSAQETAHTFPETGYTVRGSFWQYWQSHGGLAQQGYPISGEFTETSVLDGRPYTVQYFERAVFEWHPENAPPFDVLLAQLGTFRYRARYPAGAPGQHSSATDPRVFPQTGHHLGGRFRIYWEQQGGLQQQGYPLSDEFTEISDLDGRPYTVQYFERAVFEWHPENRPPYDVLLSQLGTFQQRAWYAGGSGSDPWAGLRGRPLHVPGLLPGAPCPVTPGQVVTPGFGPALGAGPVYAVGLGTAGVRDVDDSIFPAPWGGQKVLWIADPGDPGPVLIRGHQLDGPNEVRFGGGAAPAAELQLQAGAPGGAPAWSNWPSYTRVRGPGCYAYQVDGPGFSEVIPFIARATMT